jgi:hypothetical protein
MSKPYPREYPKIGVGEGLVLVAEAQHLPQEITLPPAVRFAAKDGYVYLIHSPFLFLRRLMRRTQRVTIS